MELDHYDWARLRSHAGDALAIRSALERLASGGADAERAYAVLEETTVAGGRLSESSAPVADCLVRLLGTAEGTNAVFALELLAAIGSARDDWPDDGFLGRASHEECMGHIVRAFPAYRQRLERDLDPRARRAGIDLVLLCGLHDDRLRMDAARSLQHALETDEDDSLADLTRNSLVELLGGRDG